MKTFIFIVLTCVTLFVFTSDKISYLQKNSYDLTQNNFEFPKEEFKLLGFGAYHGSQKTEAVELSLFTALKKQHNIKYYIPEMDYSTAYYFNKFLQKGDTILLKDLLMHYAVPQDRSIGTYNKWKKLKKLNDGYAVDKKITVVGVDWIASYKYPSIHLLEILKRNKKRPILKEIKQLISTDTAIYSSGYNGYAKNLMRRFVNDYEKNSEEFIIETKDKFMFDYVFNNIKYTLKPAVREPIIYKNYIALNSAFNFKENKQFTRYGFFHLEKNREGNFIPFFAQLLENDFYKKEELISVIGYLTKSRVLWERTYDEDGNYKGYVVEAGFGIGDYEKEYFRGIENLKATKLSDITLYNLKAEHTPYNENTPDLIEIIMPGKKSNSEAVKGKSTTSFLDYAVLISNSKANRPIELLNK